MDLGEIFRGKRCLITGGLGFVGSNLAWRLVELGATVHLVDACVEGHGANYANVSGIADRVQVSVADIADARAMRALVAGQEYLFHLAGQVSHIDSMNDPLRDLDINARASLAFLEVCRDVNPDAVIVYTGTRQIYGKPHQLPVDETHPIRPVDVNGVSKTAAEMFHLLYHDVYGLRTISLRLTNTYGPRMLLRHSRQGFIAWFLRQAIERGTIEIYGDGSQRRDLNEVSDVTEALLRAAATPACIGQAYNLGHTEVVSLRQIVELLAELAPGLAWQCVPWPAEKKRIDIGDYYADFSAFREATGWQPQVGLREGLERALRYYTLHRDSYLPRSRPPARKVA